MKTSTKGDFFDQCLNVARVHFKSHSSSLLVSKVALTILLYTFLIMNSLYDYVSPTHVPECIKDEMHDLTLPLNEFLNENQFYRNALIIFSSFMIDTTAFMMTARFMLFERNFKLPLTLLAMYIFRGFLQSVFFMKFPTNYIWGSPGLFSITVPYAPANDFFFSGHVGLCTICFIYFKRQNVKPMMYFAFVTIIVEFFTLLVTRAHYFIDLVIGIVVAHYIYLVGDWVQSYFNERESKKIQEEVKEQQEEKKEVKESLAVSARKIFTKSWQDELRALNKSLQEELKAFINKKSKQTTSSSE